VSTHITREVCNQKSYYLCIPKFGLAGQQGAIDLATETLHYRYMVKKKKMFRTKGHVRLWLILIICAVILVAGWLVFKSLGIHVLWRTYANNPASNSCHASFSLEVPFDWREADNLGYEFSDGQLLYPSDSKLTVAATSSTHIYGPSLHTVAEINARHDEIMKRLQNGNFNDRGFDFYSPSTLGGVQGYLDNDKLDAEKSDEGYRQIIVRRNNCFYTLSQKIGSYVYYYYYHEYVFPMSSVHYVNKAEEDAVWEHAVTSFKFLN
jgi:hypothetical protein